MQIEQIPLDEVHEYKGNPRQIPDSAVHAVAASIREFGFKVPVIMNRLWP